MNDEYDEDAIRALKGLDDIEPRIVRNSAICLLCEQEIESKYGWDFRSCRCGNLSVDGGHEYLRRVFRKHGTWKETSVYGRGKEGDGIAVEDGG